MGNIKVQQYVVGPVETNCYFVINETTKEVLVIDPGDSPKQLADRIKSEELNPVAILLTHGHFDHAGGAEKLAELLSVQIYAFEKEKQTLEDPELNAGWMMGKHDCYHADIFLKDEQEMDLAGLHFRVLHTPGHTIGGCCYYFPYEDAVFVGDTLFQMSVGRTDMKLGSMSQIVRSIKDKLLKLPEQTTVYPGHGDLTTIETERMYNPYL